ncbi:putative PurR-regulated permease PerM [Desulfohalotomaculum tongense]|uniref:AI-2E family transporter n=1 Tax=Desulforadius tongensis TaxID=1216062 RepID=UPI001959C28E|nr:AI-2E family transporter [Desulforadius tongensis]MBM7855022.1 putative PurR-regulated permease PerM [Desulforadius tongensis]
MRAWRKETYCYIFYILIFTAGAVFIYLLRELFVTFLLTIVLVYLLYPLVSSMEARGTSRVMSILMAYLALMIVAAAVFMYGVPRLVSQLHALVDMLPIYTARVEDLVREVQSSYYRTELPAGMRQAINRQIAEVELMLQGILEQTVQAILSLVGYAFNILLAPVLAFYILKDLEHIKAQVKRWLPEKKYADFWVLGRQINEVLINFIRGHLILMFVVGLMTGLAMMLLKVEYGVMLGIAAGIAELIPYFGPIIGAVPAVTVALLQSKWLALKVILAILIVQQLEGNVIAPKVLGESVGLHPLIIILVLVAGAKLFGVAGMLLAVPVAAILRILLIFGYKKMVYFLDSC